MRRQLISHFQVPFGSVKDKTRRSLEKLVHAWRKKAQGTVRPYGVRVNGGGGRQLGLTVVHQLVNRPKDIVLPIATTKTENFFLPL